jgi:hypothetical protein
MIFLCVVTSFIYTEIYIIEDNFFGERIFFKNKEFQSSVIKLLDYFFNTYEISFVALFLGPAPLISCRATLIFFQAFFLLKKIPIITVKGKELYNYKAFDAVFIQRFSGRYICIDNKLKKTTVVTSLQEADLSDYFVGLVAREFHSLPDFISYSHILFPNREALKGLAFKKYKAGKVVKKVSQISPF